MSGTLIEKRRRTALPREQAWNARARSPWPVMAIDRGLRAASDAGRKSQRGGCWGLQQERERLGGNFFCYIYDAAME
jgi:hypothetical protein